MKEYEKQMLHSLEAFINGKQPQTDIFSKCEWKSLFDLAYMHKVVPIVYESARMCKEFQNISGEFKDAVKKAVHSAVVGQIIKTEAFLRIYNRLSDNGIKALVVKGIICREMYKNPDARISADEDIYAKEEDIRKIHDLFLSEGLRPKENNIENKAVITYVDYKSGLHIELHRQLFEEDNGAYGKFNELFEEAFENAICTQIHETKLCTMRETEHMLYLILHSFKHFLHCGFGIRQVCDIVMFASKYKEKIDWQLTFHALEEFHADVFAANLFDIGEKWLGVNKPDFLTEKYKQDTDSDELLEDILMGGVYGSSSEDRLHSSSITLHMAADEKHAGIFRTAFPNAKAMKRKYEYLNRYPYLLPVAWTHRIFKYAGNRNSSARQSVNIAKHRVELMKKYKVIK